MLTDTAVAALATAFSSKGKRGRVIGTYEIQGLDQYGNPKSEIVDVRENDTAISQDWYRQFRGTFRPAP